ncbi:MAG TPA: hypothetical protein VHP33_14445 [Polyangiaceae bacterium]|nr:hypothetical protein [Polyangiaceae bacterium]
MRSVSNSKRVRAYLLLMGLVLFSATSSGAAGPPLAPPGSIEPKEKVAAVRVSHRHRAIVSCVRVPKQATCARRVAEGDTAAVVRFERMGVVTVGLNQGQGAVRVVFSHQATPQEQVINLGVGAWLVDWPDSEKLERLDITPGARVQVALVTSSGACELKNDTCELVPGVRERRIRISDVR